MFGLVQMPGGVGGGTSHCLQVVETIGVKGEFRARHALQVIDKKQVTESQCAHLGALARCARPI